MKPPDEPTIQSLLEDQNRMLTELLGPVKKRKDRWDKFSTLSTFLSGVLIAGAGLLFSHIYNQRSLEQTALLKENEQRILQMQTLETFIPHLIAGDEEKKVALIAITTLGSEDIATQLSDLLNTSEGARAAGDKIMATAPSKQQVDVPRPVKTSLDPSQASKTGWAYLGHFRPGDMKWETRYFDELSSTPHSYNGATLTVRAQTGSLNVRKGPPTAFGQFQAVTDVLLPGSKVTVDDVQEWRSSGYMWAKISYTPD